VEVKKLGQDGFRTLWVLALLVCLAPSPVRSCNVPAFRYALERWPADLYQVIVYYNTALSGDNFELLRKGGTEGGGLANYSVRTVDVRKLEGKRRADAHKVSTYPWVEISYPIHSDIRGVVWSGPLTSGSVEKILQSQTRSRLAQRLLGGDVAVWVLVRSGDEAKDRRASEALTASLKRASETLKMPEIGTDQNGDPIAVSDFKTYPVHFALTEIGRHDSDEALLVGALLKSEPDLQQYDEPMAFPVFGRGRALYALVGKGIEEKNILEACQSLLNWCSCEIKTLNPGTDLLVSADWSRPYGGKMVEDPDLPLVGLGGFVDSPAPPAATAETVKPAPAACPAVPVVATSSQVPVKPVQQASLWRNLVYLAAGAGIVLLGFSVFLRVKRKN
jgi:hypothetical protein